MYFNHLNYPDAWRAEYSKYPEGLSILESLMQWIRQVDDMVDSHNANQTTINGFGEHLDSFIAQYNARLQTTVTETLADWQASGFLDVVIDAALQTEMDNLVTTTEQSLTSFSEQLTDIVINVKKFGAKCDGVTDDTLSVRSALSATPVNGTLYIPGNCLITDTILIDKNINFISKGDIIYGGMRDRIALYFKRILNKNIEIGKVRDVSEAWHGWGNGNYVGIAFENLIYCSVKVNNVVNFTTGIRCMTTGGLSVGHFFNTYSIFQLRNNKIQLEIYYDGIQSWFNANTFHDIIFTYDQVGNEFQNAVVDRYGIKDTHVNGNEYPGDANIFYNLKFDIMLNMGGTYTGIQLERAWYWKFENYRCEFVAGTNVKFAKLDCQYNAIRGMTFNPILEMYTTRDNVHVHIINNQSPTLATTEIFEKSGIDSNVLFKELYADRNFNRRFREYTDVYSIIKGVYHFDVYGIGASSEKPYEYGAGAIVENGVNIGSPCVLYLKNFKLHDSFTVTLNTSINATDGEITLKPLDVNNALIDINTVNGIKAVSASSSYWDTTNKRIKQNVNNNSLSFSINSNDVKTIAILFSGKVSGITLKSNNSNVSVLKSIVSGRENTEQHRVHAAPTKTAGFDLGEILLNDNTAVGQVVGWELQNNAGTLTWVAFGIY